MFTRLTERAVVWVDATTQDVDAVIWCTGFRPPRSARPCSAYKTNGWIPATGTRATPEPRLHLLVVAAALAACGCR